MCTDSRFEWNQYTLELYSDSVIKEVSSVLWKNMVVIS